MPDTVLIAEEMNMNKLVFILKEFMIWWGENSRQTSYFR